MPDLNHLNNNSIKSQPPLAAHQREELEHQIHQALQTIRDVQKNKRTKLNARVKATPWVLLLGQAGAGKTSLLKHAGIELKSANNKTLDLIKSTKSIDWWINNEVVFIDPAAEYTANSNNWRAFLKLLTKKIQRPFDSLCLVIDLPRLAHADEITYETQLRELQQQLEIVAELQPPICVNLIITQCDQIRGFAEFFNSLSPEEQQQPCGFSIIDPNSINHYSQSFATQFEQFTKLINTKLLERLHHEPNLERRQRLSDFPLQLERLLPALNKLIDSFRDSPQVVLNSLFFCSTQQSIDTIDFLAEDLSRSFNLRHSQQVPLIANQRALFIPGMMQEISRPFIPETANPKKLARKGWLLATYPVALSIILVAAFLLHQSYHSSSITLKAGNQALTLENPGLLPTLDQLYKLKQELAAPHSTLSFNTTNQLKNEATLAYTTALQKQFGPYLQNNLSLLVREQTTHNSPELYDTLRTYLMFTTPQKMQTDFVKRWLALHWQKQLQNNPDYQQQMQLYLSDYLRLNLKPWAGNQALVSQAQQALQQQPLALLAFRMLRNSYSLADAPIKSSLNIDGVDLSQAMLPDFYQTESFTKIYNQEIPKLAASYLKGNWVIGKDVPDNTDLNSLTKDLRQIYVNAYLTAWQEGLVKVKFIVPKSYADAINQINLLTNAESPLWLLYQKAIDTARNAGAKEETDRFLNANALSNYLPGQPKALLLVQTLKPLQQYLQTLNDAPSSQKEAFDKAAKRFNPAKDDTDPLGAALQQANTLPEPLQDWQRQIATSSWQLMLIDAKTYINTMWKATVVPIYTNSIKDRYPIFPTASNDISVADFNRFFGPDGIMQNFFKTIEPFVDMSQAYWTWKQVDGTTLDIPQADLDMLIRASMIQKMFYTDDPHRPTVRFKLTPVEMTDSVSQFVLNVGGQMIRYLPGLQKTDEGSWPSTDGKFVTMRFSSGLSNPTVTTTGDWAWQKMLDKATLQGTNDPQHYQVTFKLEGNQVVYDLIADNPINPYLPNILAGFRVPVSF